jgi:hypothetical protein
MLHFKLVICFNFVVVFFFKVACVPFKPNCLGAFIQILKAPFRILKDFIQIMKMELVCTLCIIVAVDVLEFAFVSLDKCSVLRRNYVFHETFNLLFCKPFICLTSCAVKVVEIVKK